jgi:PAS domain S-box-containing protein
MISPERLARRPFPSWVTQLAPLTRYAIAVAAAVLAVLLRLFLDPLWDLKLPLITFFPAVMVSAWLGGLGAGITTTLLCAMAAAYFWMPPVLAFAVTDVGDIVALAVFVGIGITISGLNEAWRRASARVETTAEELRVTLASIGDAVIATDSAGRVTLLNPVAEALTGWSDHQATGRPLADVFVIVNERSRRPVENPVERVLRDGTVAGLANHTVLLARDGREIPIEDSAAPIRTAEGPVIGAVIVFRDITRRARAERRQELQQGVTRVLAEATTLHEALPQVLPLIGEGLGWDFAAFWSVDPASGVLRCEDAWHRGSDKLDSFEASTRREAFAVGIGYPGRVWASGEPVWLASAAEASDFFPASDAIHGAVFVPVQSRTDVTAVLEVVSQQVQPYDADVAVTLSSVANRIGHFLERLQTDADRARLLAQEQEARREAEASSRTKDEFLAMLSHELRTPLMTILGWVRTLRTGQVPSEQVQAALASIERNTRLQGRLIDDLLDVSRIVSGKLSLDIQAVALAGVVKDAIEAVRAPAATAGVRVSAELDPTPALIGDVVRLYQVVGNLLSNAIKFTERGGRVEVQMQQVGSTVVLTVRDTGRGIRAELLPHVFDRFRQGEPSGPRAAGGLGLGLTIVRHLVELHGGTVEVASPGEGQGATFTVRLPIAPGEPTGTVPEREPRLPSSLAPGTLDGVRVLVVEDHGDTRDLLVTVFSSAHAAVRSARSINEAREILEKGQVDVVVSDLSLAGEDGHALVRHLRATEMPPQRLVCVALTAHAREEDRARALAAGFDAYVRKPLDPAELVGLIIRALER